MAVDQAKSSLLSLTTVSNYLAPLEQKAFDARWAAARNRIRSSQLSISKFDNKPSAVRKYPIISGFTHGQLQTRGRSCLIPEAQVVRELRDLSHAKQTANLAIRSTGKRF